MTFFIVNLIINKKELTVSEHISDTHREWRSYISIETWDINSQLKAQRKGKHLRKPTSNISMERILSKDSSMLKVFMSHVIILTFERPRLLQIIVTRECSLSWFSTTLQKMGITGYWSCKHTTVHSFCIKRNTVVFCWFEDSEEMVGQKFGHIIWETSS